MKKPLSPLPRREDLTDRECTSIIGGLLGGLVQNADLESVRNAVRWWAETDEAWEFLRNTKEVTRFAGEITHEVRPGFAVCPHCLNGAAVGDVQAPTEKHLGVIACTECAGPKFEGKWQSFRLLCAHCAETNILGSRV